MLTVVKIMWEILHQETGVACSRNSLSSPPGRPSPSLLQHASSEPTGVATSGVNLSLFLPRLQLLRSALFSLTLLGLTQLAILGLASVSVHTSAALGHPGRNSRPLFSAGFLHFGGLEISTLIRLFNRGSHPFSSFGNLILA